MGASSAERRLTSTGRSNGNIVAFKVLLMVPVSKPPLDSNVVFNVMLGTSPEKDVGFPYRSSLVPGRDAEVDERMMRWSWQAYLVAIDQFVGWVDRGRPAPTRC